MIKKRLLVAAAGLILLSVGGCKKQLDINENPNVAQDVTPALLLPTAQLEIGSALGVDMNNNGSIWVQYWTQNASASQYRTLERYQPTASTYDRVWSLFYSGALPDLKRMNQLATASNLRQYQAISNLLTAYSFQLLTDAWGDVPFTEALKGLTEEGAVLNPRFDRQEAIYDSVIQITQVGLALVDEEDPNHPGSDDLIYQGNMANWRKFGNTLLLKMYLRLSERSPAKAQAGIAALYNSGAEFIGSEDGDDAQISYSTGSGSSNPLAVEARRLGQNQIASATSADSMNSNNDPRRAVFYNAATPTTAIRGLRQGETTAQSGVTYNIPNSNTGANAAAVGSEGGLAASSAPVKFISSYESLFLQAEVVARGWATGDAADLFSRGISANFASYGLEEFDEDYQDEAYWAQYPTGGSVSAQIRHIITQKWFSMNGNQGFEAWTEWRRTGYPEFLVVSAGSLIGNQFPARFFYPDAEFSRNANFPGQPRITDRVWWDVN